MILSDTKVKTFGDYLECVATGSKALTDADDRQLTGPRFDKLLELYLLGQKLQDHGMQNMVVDEILAAGIRPGGSQMWRLCSTCTPLPSVQGAR